MICVGEILRAPDQKAINDGPRLIKLGDSSLDFRSLLEDLKFR